MRLDSILAKVLGVNGLFLLVIWSIFLFFCLFFGAAMIEFHHADLSSVHILHTLRKSEQLD